MQSIAAEKSRNSGFVIFKCLPTDACKHSTEKKNHPRKSWGEKKKASVSRSSLIVLAWPGRRLRTHLPWHPFIFRATESANGEVSGTESPSKVPKGFFIVAKHAYGEVVQKNLHQQNHSSPAKRSLRCPGSSPLVLRGIGLLSPCPPWAPWEAATPGQGAEAAPPEQKCPQGGCGWDLVKMHKFNTSSPWAHNREGSAHCNC